MTQTSHSEIHGGLCGVAGRLPGEVLAPGMDGYAEAAAALFATGTPDLVVRPPDEDGVAAALRHATSAGMAVTVRSGGHSMAGLSTHTGGMVIDLRNLCGVEVLDLPGRRVRVGAGATWGAVADALAPYGLGLTAGDTREVGVGGLTLGGGIGWLVRRHGLAVDNLAAAELVTADGERVRADAGHHGDLFWALRGGGGNFGVVTSFEFVAQPVTTVHFGTIGYECADPRSLIARWRDLVRDGDENLTTILNLMPSAVMLQCCYDGPDAEAALRPYRALAPVTADTVRAMPYADVLESCPALPPGARMEMRNALVPALDDATIEGAADLLADGAMVTLRSLGGAVARVAPDATAYAHRDAEALVIAGVMVPSGAPQRIATAPLARWSAIADRSRGAYVNFLGTATGADVARVYPPDTYRRLAEVKRGYDPGNVFRRTHNVAPARG
ncbi:FAD-binding oxidoreductase [Actinomadura sp. DC4]|uniref:FAD-binding oxidoreductase n=1 Tax=Actinomadura sp. DC4 TaxID=3055069 RepID=UPI0025B0AF51|nr:FAD-binding oxidoreductase [Actinomadura sp. DC4]MDN3352277.1 FAD-binding oxidoreductase [Actinomadura sp. DC4]